MTNLLKLLKAFLPTVESQKERDEAYIEAQLDHYYDLGVRAIFPVHKYDNKFSPGDGDRAFIELGNFANSGHWSNFTLDCPDPQVGGFDSGDVNFGGLNMPRDVYDSKAPIDNSKFPTAPLDTTTKYLAEILAPPLMGPYCQNGTVTPLGEHLVGEMMARGNLVSPTLNDAPRHDKPILICDVAGSAKPLATQLCVILDDHSRLSPCSRYGTAADTRHFHALLKEALRRRGVPKALYVDNGGPFVNDHTRLVCAQLGIRLLHSRPYHAWARGKVERFIQTLQQDFQARLQIPGQAASSLDELNHRLADWLAEYHARVHSTTGLRPDERFAQGLSLVKSLAPELDLERLFYAQATRRVRKDGTIRLENDLYEVDLSLRGLEVRLRFDPWTRQRIEVDYRGQSFGLARLVDRQLNGRLQADYEKR